MDKNALFSVVPKQGWRMKLTESEIKELMLYLLRKPEIFAEARGLIHPEHFKAGEARYAAILATELDIVDEHGVTLPDRQFRFALESELKSRIEQDPDFGDDDIAAIYGPNVSDEGVVEEGAPDEPTDASRGFLPWAFSIKPRQLDADRGRKLLQRFLRERAIQELFSFANALSRVPKNPVALLEECIRRLQRYDNLGRQPVQSLAEEWEEHKEQLQEYRGRRFIGLRTGMAALDERTLGLRGLTVCGAMPGVGKTTLFIQIALGVAEHYQDNDAVVVILSLDMTRKELRDRIHCNLGGINWTTLKLGSPDCRDRGEEPWFNNYDQRQLDCADRRITEEGIGSRIQIHDRFTLGDTISATRLAGLVEEFKTKVGAKRSLLIVDYLQLLPVAEDVLRTGELEADRCRVRLVQDYLEQTRTKSNPAGDAVVVISEARKPANPKEGWGQAMSDLMGSARLAYAPDAVLLYRTASKADLKAFHNATDANVEWLQARMEAEGRAPIVLTLAKGRDGMRRGEWGLEFDFRRSIFREVACSHGPAIPTSDDAEDGAPDPAANPPAATPTPPLPPAGRRRTARNAAPSGEANGGTTSSNGTRARNRGGGTSQASQTTGGSRNGQTSRPRRTRRT